MTIMTHARTAILLPPLTFLEDAPLVTLTSHVIEKNVLVTYPISLFTREDRGKMNWLGFLYAFLFIRKDGKKVAQISYPLCFDQSHQWEIFERLFKEVEELASAFKASQIVYEGYNNVRKPLFKPYSAIAFGNTVNAAFLDFVKTKGFTQTDVNYCCEIEWSPHRTCDVNLYTISDFYKRRREYLELCRASPSFNQLFDVESVAALPPHSIERFFKREWVIFTESEKGKCCLRWFPQSIFAKEMTREAKIARILFTAPEAVFDSAVETLNYLHAQGKPRVQIADIPENLINDLEKMGASPVHETVYMVYQCSKG